MSILFRVLVRLLGSLISYKILHNLDVRQYGYITHEDMVLLALACIILCPITLVVSVVYSIDSYTDGRKYTKKV